jgi:hypothetical protein
MWLIKPGMGSLCVDLKGKEFWFTKDGRLCISQGNGRHFFTYSSEDAAIAMQTAIIAAIKSGKAYLEPAEVGLERGEHEWADRTIQASKVGWKTQDTPEVTVRKLMFTLTICRTSSSKWLVLFMKANQRLKL